MRFGGLGQNLLFDIPRFPIPGAVEDRTAQGSSAHPRKGTAQIDIQGVDKSYGPRPVLRGIDLHCAAGQFVAVVGRSGCGKSTLLRVLAGLERADAGTVRISSGGESVQARSAIRVMFQDSRLLPWKRVLDNVALGSPDAEFRSRALDLLERVGLPDLARDWPSVLSGGQRQRVALARALLQTPSLLLLDEPLGALDALTRIEMQGLLEALWLERRFTALLVTHDVAEAITLADRVLLIDEGRIAMDIPVEMPRPRKIDAAFAALEQRVLDRLLGAGRLS
jgi:sulfonate transport system ATP-binding protein